MASGVTNIGKIRLLELGLRDTQDSAAADTSPMYMALATSAMSLSSTTILFDTSTQIFSDTAGGYTDGGLAIERDGSSLTVWDTLTDTAGDYGLIRLKDLVWTGTGGTLPRSGTGAFYAVLTDDNDTVGSRQVYAWWDLGAARQVGSGATLTLQDIEIRLT